MDEIRMGLEAAVRSYAEESRRDLEEHPSIAELDAYRSGESSLDERERLQDHLAVCHSCADLVLDLEAFPRLQPPAGQKPVSVQEVEAAWKEMGPALLSATVVGSRSRSVPEPTATAGEPAARGWWDEIRKGFSQMFASSRLAYSLAAMLLLAIPLTRYWTVHQLTRPDSKVTIHSLDVQRTRSVPHEITVPRDARQAILVFNVLAESTYADYAVELFDLPAGGAPRWRQEGLQPGPIGNFVLLLPRQLLPAGRWLIRISGRGAESAEVVAEYEVQVRYGGQAEDR